jgi:hypothetical protein
MGRGKEVRPWGWRRGVRYPTRCGFCRSTEGVEWVAVDHGSWGFFGPYCPGCREAVLSCTSYEDLEGRLRLTSILREECDD